MFCILHVPSLESTMLWGGATKKLTMNGKIVFKNLHDLAEFIANLEYHKVQSKWSVTRQQYTQYWELCFEE